MESIYDLIITIFSEAPSIDEYMNQCEEIFKSKNQITDKEAGKIFELLEELIEKEESATHDINILAKLFFFIGELSRNIKEFQNAFLSLEKALYFIEGKNLNKHEQFISEKMKSIFNIAFPPYENEKDAFKDYFFLCKNMVMEYLDELEDRGYDVEDFSDIYVTQLEIELFDRFKLDKLKSPKSFMDFHKYITYREVATKISGKEFSYFRIVDRFKLSSMDFLILMLLYFSITVRPFERMLKKAWTDYLISSPTVAFLEELFSFFFPIDNFINKEFGVGSLLVEQGLIHLLYPPDKQLSSFYEQFVVIDDNIVSFFKTRELDISTSKSFIVSEYNKETDVAPSIDKNFNKFLKNNIEQNSYTLYIHDPYDSGVFNEILTVLPNNLGITVFDFEKIFENNRNSVEITIKSLLLYSDLSEFIPVFLITSLFKDNEKKKFDDVLKVLNKVTKKQKASFIIVSKHDYFDTISSLLENVKTYQANPPKGEEQMENWDYWIKKLDIKINKKDLKEITATTVKSRVNVKKVLLRLQGKSDRITLKDVIELISLDIETEFGFIAQKITPRFSWNNIVLNQDTLIKVNEIITFFRYKNQVMQDWGFEKLFPYGKAISALFYGAPGTGKTMMSHVIAKDLKMDLFRVDLSTVISKYIGETEKNIKKIFDAAKSSPTVLLFEEADSLFTKEQR